VAEAEVAVGGTRGKVDLEMCKQGREVKCRVVEMEDTQGKHFGSVEFVDFLAEFGGDVEVANELAPPQNLITHAQLLT
jgi:hypothetical protein